MTTINKRLTFHKLTDGSDGDGIEYIYARSKTLITSWKTIYFGRKLQVYNDSVKIEDGTTDENNNIQWYDHPQGIDGTNYLYEYSAMRTGNGSNRHHVDDTSGWTAWCAPAVFSAWGEKGNDGDGVEYIFCITASDADKPDTPAVPVANATTRVTASFVNTDANGTQRTWTNEPTTMLQGQVTWECMRHFVDGAWVNTYSAPALWSRYAADGANATFYSIEFNPQAVNKGSATSAAITIIKHYGSNTEELNDLPTGSLLKIYGSGLRSAVDLTDDYSKGDSIYNIISGHTDFQEENQEIDESDGYVYAELTDANNKVLARKYLTYNGTAGGAGKDGKGISKIDTYYLANTGTEPGANGDTGGNVWHEKQSDTSWGVANKYLWIKTTTTYSDASTSSDIHIAALYTEDGKSVTIDGKAAGHYASLDAYCTASSTWVSTSLYLIDDTSAPALYGSGSSITIADRAGYIVGTDLWVWKQSTGKWTDVGQITGAPGANGKDKPYLLLYMNGTLTNSITLSTDEDGKISAANQIIKLGYRVVNGTQKTGTKPTFVATNCTETDCNTDSSNYSTTGAGNNTNLPNAKITAIDNQTATDTDGTTKYDVSKTSAQVTVQVTLNDETISGTYYIDVNVAAFFGTVDWNRKQLQAKFTEYQSTNDSKLTEYKSLIDVNAKKIEAAVMVDGVERAGAKFDATEGVTFTGDKFRLKNTSGTETLTVDADGNLQTKGDAYFGGKIKANAGQIGGWSINSTSLQCLSDGAEIYVDPNNTGTFFLHIGGSKTELIRARADGGTGLDIYTQGTSGTCIRMTAQTGATAIESYGKNNIMSRFGERTLINGLAVASVVTQVSGTIGVSSGLTYNSYMPNFVFCDNNTDTITLTLPTKALNSEYMSDSDGRIVFIRKIGVKNIYINALAGGTNRLIRDWKDSDISGSYFVNGNIKLDNGKLCMLVYIESLDAWTINFLD